MAEIIKLPGCQEEPDPKLMDREELLDYLEQVREELARLDEEEPKDMDSEAYEHWGDQHEALEDLADDLMDRLDEIGE